MELGVWHGRFSSAVSLLPYLPDPNVRSMNTRSHLATPNYAKNTPDPYNCAGSGEMVLVPVDLNEHMSPQI